MDYEKRLKEVDSAILTATGDPNGEPPDVASYLRILFGDKSLSDFLETATWNEISLAQYDITMKTLDHTLCRDENEEGIRLINFCIYKLSARLTELNKITKAA